MPIPGFDSANGGEFLNWHLVTYFRQRPAPVGLTRSRLYRKNANARVEQKNWTHVRQLVGYVRLEGPTAAALLDDLYRHEWGWLRNFFCPVMTHLRTEVVGSRKKTHLRPTGHAFPTPQGLRPLAPVLNPQAGTMQ